MKIKNKLESHRLYEQGAFGNRIRIYPNFDEWYFGLEEGSLGKYGLRYTDPNGGGGWFRTEMNWLETFNEHEKWIKEGANPGYIRVYDSLPHEALLIQGELTVLEGKLEFTYTTEKGVPNRPSMWKEKRTASDKEVWYLLQKHMWEPCYNNLIRLIYEYPGAVIEFSVCDRAVGILPDQNTIFWEVRHY